MTTLPPGWVTATIADTGRYINGLAFKPSDWGTTGRPIIRIQNLTDRTKGFNRTEQEFEADFIVRRGEILVSWSATLDAFIWQGEEGVLNQHIFRVEPGPAVDARFLYHLLRQSIAEMRESEHLHGSTMKHINRGPFLAHAIKLPPRNEQKRIATKLDEIFEQTSGAKGHLECLPALFVQLKRSILAAAFRGDLTADWRAAHPNDEPASALAGRIRAKRDDRTSLPPDTAYSSQLPNTDLPKTWFVTPTANVGHVQVGRRRAQGEYTGQLHPYVRVANVADDRISYDDINEMEFSPLELEQYLLRPGDIVLSEGQSLDRVGQSAMYRDGDPAVCYQATLNRFRATSAGPLPEYAQLYFRFCLHTGVFRAAGSITTNIAHLTQEKLRRIPFVLCPLDEQRVLVERVRGALARLDALEAGSASALAKLPSIEQAALAKAFRGELVEQDPNDEPAAITLERIRDARARVDSPTSTRGKASPRAKQLQSTARAARQRRHLPRVTEEAER